MADTKGSALTQITTIADGDGIYVVDDLAGTPVSKLITKVNLQDDLVLTLSQTTDVTATAAEVNLVDGSVAGTAVASKALVLGSTKNIDTIDIIKDGLKIGTVAVTTTSAELNILDGATLSTTELNYVTGVTSAIQTQIDAKAASADVAFLLEYFSSAQTITAGGQLTLAHGLGVRPKVVQYILNCTSTDAGYSAGDWVMTDYSATLSTSRNNNPRLTTTNIAIRFSDDTNPFVVQNKTTGVSANADSTKWALYVRAFA